MLINIHVLITVLITSLLQTLRKKIHGIYTLIHNVSTFYFCEVIINLPIATLPGNKST